MHEFTSRHWRLLVWIFLACFLGGGSFEGDAHSKINCRVELVCQILLCSFSRDGFTTCYYRLELKRLFVEEQTKHSYVVRLQRYRWISKITFVVDTPHPLKFVKNTIDTCKKQYILQR